MKLHKVTLTDITTETKVEYLLELAESEAFDLMELLSELHEIIHGGKWNAITSLVV